MEAPGGAQARGDICGGFTLPRRILFCRNLQYQEMRIRQILALVAKWIKAFLNFLYSRILYNGARRH